MRSLSLMVFTFLLVACNYHIDKTGAAGGNNSKPSGSGGGDGGGAEADFNSVMEFSIRPACLECHSAPRNASGINLETYAAVKADIGAVKSALETSFMPDSVGRSMTDEQRSFFLDWISAGAPETAQTQTNEGVSI